MDIKINFINEPDTIALKQAYTDALDEVMAGDKEVMTVEADLSAASGVLSIEEKYPDRVLNVGIAEANMIGMSAGLSRTGKKVYAHSFAAFVARRAFDQIFISCAYGKNSLRLYGSDPGVYTAFNGGTHMSFEDLGIMRTIPGAVIFDVCDSVMMGKVVKMVKDIPGIVYFRAGRGVEPKIYPDDTEFPVGKSKVLIDGSDVVIFTGGVVVSEALKAAKLLEDKGISAAIVDLYCVKPIDADTIVSFAKKTGAVVTTDNHNVNGGLGDAVASVLCEKCPTPMLKLGINEEFGEVGSVDFLKGRFGLDAEGIVKKAEEALKLK